RGANVFDPMKDLDAELLQFGGLGFDSYRVRSREEGNEISLVHEDSKNRRKTRKTAACAHVRDAVVYDEDAFARPAIAGEEHALERRAVPAEFPAVLCDEFFAILVLKFERTRGNADVDIELEDRLQWLVQTAESRLP